MKAVELDGDYIVIRVRNSAEKAQNEGYLRDRVFVRDPLGKQFAGWVELEYPAKAVQGSAVTKQHMVCSKCSADVFTCVHATDADLLTRSSQQYTHKRRS